METAEILSVFVEILKKAYEQEQELIDESISTLKQKQVNDDLTYREVGDSILAKLRQLNPARIDLYRGFASLEREETARDGLWIVALALQDYPKREALTEDYITAIMAVKMVNGEASFGDILGGAVYYKNRYELEFLTISDNRAVDTQGRPFEASKWVDEIFDEAGNEHEFEDEDREETGIPYAIWLAIYGAVYERISGNFNAAEAIFGYTMFTAVGGKSEDEKGPIKPETTIKDSQRLRFGVVKKVRS